ncbi:hypothetical protein SVIOM74S_00625 [Streptomyces violarus]
MPGMPASPRNRAHRDQPNAASVPRETSVSMVAAPCRAFVQAARWNGSPPQTTTGAARVSESHCQLSNWSAGIIASRTTGTARAAETTRRRRRTDSSGSSPEGRVPSAVCSSSRAGAGSSAVYPVFTTVAIRSATSMPAG